MSLYTSVYWTKRVIVVLALIIFVCGGIRIFQGLGSSLTKDDTQVSGFKPEMGFGKLNRLNIKGMDTGDFKPSDFRISTTKGNLDPDNLYPTETTQSPLSNVYRITEQPINLGTSQRPVETGKKMGFTQIPKEESSTLRSWNEKNRELTIDGQYTLIKYINRNLKVGRPSTLGTIDLSLTNDLQSVFTQTLSQFSIQSDLDDYTFSGTLMNFDSKTGEFAPSGSSTEGSFIKVNAKRFYPNLVKTDEIANARAVYADYAGSNNYIIIPNIDIDRNFLAANTVVEMSLYNWVVNQDLESENPNVQTYSIKTPQEAYTQMVNGDAELVYVAEALTKKNVAVSELAGAELVDVLSVRVDMYEEVTYTKYIQPIYVFFCEVQKGDKKFNITYYIPALTASSLN